MIDQEFILGWPSSINIHKNLVALQWKYENHEHLKYVWNVYCVWPIRCIIEPQEKTTDHNANYVMAWCFFISHLYLVFFPQHSRHSINNSSVHGCCSFTVKVWSVVRRDFTRSETGPWQPCKGKVCIIIKRKEEPECTTSNCLHKYFQTFLNTLKCLHQVMWFCFISLITWNLQMLHNIPVFT